MKKYLVYSSETYLLKISELLSLADNEAYADGQEVVLMSGNLHKKEWETLLSGRKILEQAKKNGETFYPVRFAYYSFGPLVSFFIGLLKPLKRSFYVEGMFRFQMRLKDILAMNLKRGIRDEHNAYNWTNKRWAMSKEEREKRYDTLYKSIKEKGYNDRSPIFIMLNRNLGVRDQLFQGHHRLNICEELGVEELTVRFWTSTKAPSFMRFFEKIVSRIKGLNR